MALPNLRNTTTCCTAMSACNASGCVSCRFRQCHSGQSQLRFAKTGTVPKLLFGQSFAHGRWLPAGGHFRRTADGPSAPLALTIALGRMDLADEVLIAPHHPLDRPVRNDVFASGAG